MRVALPIALFALVCGCDKPAPPSPPTTAAQTTAKLPVQPPAPPPKTNTFKVGEFAADSLPDGLAVQGKVWHGARFTDSNGDNVVVLSIAEETLDLHMVQAVVVEGAPPKIVSEVKHERGECEFDYSAAFEAPPYITDADNDDVAEVTFAFKYACRSDVSPQDFAVFLLEGGKESNMRGTELLLIEGDPEPIGGGQAVEAGFEGSPELLEQCKRIYRRHILTRM